MQRHPLKALVIAAVLVCGVPLALSHTRLSTGTIVYNYVGRIYVPMCSNVFFPGDDSSARNFTL